MSADCSERVFVGREKPRGAEGREADPLPVAVIVCGMFVFKEEELTQRALRRRVRREENPRRQAGACGTGWAGRPFAGQGKREAGATKSAIWENGVPREGIGIIPCSG